MGFRLLLLLVLWCGSSTTGEKCVDLQPMICPQMHHYCDSFKTYTEINCRKTCEFCTTTTLTPAPLPVGSSCGTPAIKGIRVIAGETAVPGSWPWQVLMKYRGQAKCGGTLIAPQWVVTAAHCVFRRNNPRDFIIMVGEHDRERNEGSEAAIAVSRIVIHPDYNPRRLQNDIAMFKLARPVAFNKYVSPACLPKKAAPVGSTCYITGWGKTTPYGHMTRFLQQGRLPVVSNRACYEKNRKVIPIPITDAMICAGSGGTQRTSGCHGDSGGPLVCNINGVWELHGSVSYGSSVCSSTETYTVFAKTLHFVGWIKENINNN